MGRAVYPESDTGRFDPPISPYRDTCDLAAVTKGIGAQEKTRTSTTFLPQVPETCASTNSATWATWRGYLLGRTRPVKRFLTICSRWLFHVVAPLCRTRDPA